MKSAQFAAAIAGAMHPANTDTGLSLEKIAAAVGAYEPSRDERLQLARIQARLGLQAIKDGEIAAARAFLADALGYLERAGEASR